MALKPCFLGAYFVSGNERIRREEESPDFSEGSCIRSAHLRNTLRTSFSGRRPQRGLSSW